MGKALLLFYHEEAKIGGHYGVVQGHVTISVEPGLESRLIRVEPLCFALSVVFSMMNYDRYKLEDLCMLQNTICQN